MIEAIKEQAEAHPAVAASLAVAGAGAGAAVLWKYLQPEKNHDGGENYFDIIANLDECIRSEEGCEDVSYFMLGGGAAAALADERTIVDIRNHRIIPPADIRKDQYRSDNGTMADVDILVMSADEDVITSVKSALEPKKVEDGDIDPQKESAKPGAKLKIGVTGLMPGSEYHDEPSSMVGRAIKTIKKDWVSQRLSYENGVRTFAISDVEVELPSEYFEPWEMVLKDGKSVSVPHPLIQVLNYLSRACHGVREQRDGEKVDKMMQNIGPLFGAGVVWDDKRQTAKMTVESPEPGVNAAVDFVDRKNSLRWQYTQERMGKLEAGLLAARIAIHRKLDTWKFVRALGQDGILYDKVISKFSGERQ